VNDATRVDVPPLGVLALLVGVSMAVAIVFLVRALPKEARRWPMSLLCGLMAGTAAGLGSAVFFLLVKIDVVRSEQARHEEMRAMGWTPPNHRLTSGP